MEEAREAKNSELYLKIMREHNAAMTNRDQTMAAQKQLYETTVHGLGGKIRSLGDGCIIL
jgi:predicted NUDIX family phosphoesterase